MKKLYVFILLACLCTCSLVVSAKQTQDAKEKETLYKWYVEHYTGLSTDDIAEIKAAHDKNKELDKDPNIKMDHCNGCNLLTRFNYETEPSK